MSQAHPAARYRVYFLAWLWLGVLTALSLGVSRLPLSKAVEASLLIVLSGLKVWVIAAFFMHLRFEKLQLVLVAVTPIIFGIILFLGITPDTTDTATRVLKLFR